jgi:hypothetical protein
MSSFGSRQTGRPAAARNARLRAGLDHQRGRQRDPAPGSRYLELTDGEPQIDQLWVR